MYVSVKNSPVATVMSFRGVSRTVVALGFVSLLTDISAEMASAVLPLFIVVQLGLSPFTYGVVEGVYQAGSVVARLLGGYLSDLKRPKLVAGMGYGLSAACKVLLLAATNLPTILGIVALDRAGKGLRTAPRDAMIADATSHEMMGRAFGVHRAMDTFGALLGPIAAWLILLAATDDFELVFIVSFCFALLGLIVLAFLRPEQDADSERLEAHQPPAPKLSLAAVVVAISSKEMRTLVLMTLFLSLATIGDGFLYLALAQAGAVQTLHFPLLFVATSLIYLLAAVPMGNIADRIGRNNVFLAGFMFLLVAYLAVASFEGAAGLVLSIIALGLYYAATDGVLSALAAPLLSKSVRSSGLAVVQATQAFGRAAGAIGFGLVWSFLGLTVAIWVFVGVLTLAIIGAFCFLASPLGEVESNE